MWKKETLKQLAIGNRQSLLSGKSCRKLQPSWFCSDFAQDAISMDLCPKDSFGVANYELPTNEIKMKNKVYRTAVIRY